MANTDSCYNLYRGVEQLAAHLVHTQKVIGSSPIPATKWLVYLLYTYTSGMYNSKCLLV